MIKLVILTYMGIYAVNLSTKEMDITLNTKIGTITRNITESGIYNGIDSLPATFDNTSPLTGTMTVGTGMTGNYSVTSGQTGRQLISPGYGANFRMIEFSVVSVGQAPTNFTGSKRVDVLADYGPIPAGTMY